uniref:phasin family protein n=1 Tax=Pseudovibrio sp. POLY-S9 TaxID=1576596 RepID=UPI00137AD078
VLACCDPPEQSESQIEVLGNLIDSNFDRNALAQRMFQARDMEELVGLQQEYLHKQMEQSGAQMREMGEKASRAVKDAAKKAGDF